MLERSRVCFIVLLVVLGGCVAPPAEVAAPVAAAPQPPAPAPERPPASRLEEAKAMLAQAETDIQRARAKRALWLKAWEDLLAARRAMAANDAAATINHAKRASELAQLGLEQLAYPAVK
jgi:hypothetical protein